MNRSRILKFVLIIEICALIINATAISRDYQDSWILEGLEIPYVIFTMTYILYIFLEKETKWILPFALLFRVVIVLIPNLKYVWFQGTAIDQHGAYRLAEDIRNIGYIPTGRAYSETPLMHLDLAIFSKLTSIPILSTFKYLPVLMWSIYPLVTYSILKSSGMTTEKSLLKYALIVSSIPIETAISPLTVSGSLIGTLLALLLLSQLMRLLQTKDRRDWIIVAIYGVALINAHSYSSTMLTGTLFAVYLLTELIRKLSPRFAQLQLRTLLTTSIIIGLMNLAWLSHKANWMLEFMASHMIRYLARAMGTQVLVPETRGLRLFELARIDFMEGLKVFLVWRGATLFVICLVSIGVIVVAKEGSTRMTKAIRNHSKSLTALCAFVMLLLFYLSLGLALGIASGWPERQMRMLTAISPIFCGISLFYIKKRIRIIPVLFVSILMILATVQLYGCQPLIPSANVINKELPADEPIGYRVVVNSVYQRRLIEHAERYMPENKLIACDGVTQNQIVGMTSWDFSASHIAWYYPLDKSVPERKYDYFFIHIPGKSGRFQEEAEIRTTNLILEAIYNSSIIYTNGESFILDKP